MDRCVSGGGEWGGKRVYTVFTLPVRLSVRYVWSWLGISNKHCLLTVLIYNLLICRFIIFYCMLNKRIEHKVQQKLDSPFPAA